MLLTVGRLGVNMKVLVDNQIRIKKPNQDLKDWCGKNLVVENPEYVKMCRMNLWTGKTPKQLRLYEKDGEDLILPYGCLDTVIENMDRRDSIELTMPQPKMVWYGTDVPLYDYQQEAVAEALAAQYGILQAPAGSGKTQMGIAMAVRLGRRALWLTHTHDLLEQSKERAEQYMSEDLIGTITDGKVDIGKGITFATVQTMCKLDLAQYKHHWDVIIVDECHRVAGTPTAMTQFSKVLNSLGARHKYGLSATVHRADGLIVATYALLGRVVWQVPEEAVAERIMKVNIWPRPTGVVMSRECLDTDGTIIYAKMVSWLASEPDRNDLIICDLYANQDHSNLILSDRLAHLKYLIDHLPDDIKDKAVMISGKMTSKKEKEARAQALEDMRTGKKRYLFATYALAKEGLDIPRLDRLYLTTPQKDYAVVAQSIGRIARTAKGKGEPICFDYVDSKIPYLLRSYKKRCTTYRKLGCRIFTEEE